MIPLHFFLNPSIFPKNFTLTSQKGRDLLPAKINIVHQENLPMPLIYLASADDLAHWYVSQLTWALNQGYRELTISCFDTAPMGFDVTDAAATVLDNVLTFLWDHPQVNQLQILCGDAAAFRAYSLQWNMTFASCWERNDPWTK